MKSNTPQLKPVQAVKTSVPSSSTKKPPSLFICPACDAKNSSLEEECRECGVRIRDGNEFATQIICPACDAKNSSLGDEECSECGVRIRDGDELATQIICPVCDTQNSSLGEEECSECGSRIIE